MTRVRSGLYPEVSIDERKFPVGKDPHDPPLREMENDRILRTQSYVKDFKPLKMGTIHLEKGHDELALLATDIPGARVMDFRLLMFTRKD